MDRILSNITKNHQRYFFVFIAVFVLLTCPVKSSIKSLVGIPVNTEQGFAKGSKPVLANGTGQCVYSEITDSKISQTNSANGNGLLPAIVLTAAFLFLLGYKPSNEQPHPFYRSLKIAETLPLFILYQKLIIYHLN